MDVVVIGGSDAGISAALRARELDAQVQVTVLLADEYPNYSICGLPYLIGGEVPDWRRLAHHTDFPGIDIRRGHRATSIDPGVKVVRVDRGDDVLDMRYDRLIIATGARPVRPDLPGVERPGVHLLHTIDEGRAMLESIERERIRSAVIVGAGYIGPEMAEALGRQGLDVTLLSRAPEVMPSVIPEIGSMIRQKLVSEGIKVLTSIEVEGIEDGLTVVAGDGRRYTADLVLFATGVTPASELASAAGAVLGTHGAIEVSDRMATSLPDVFAAGDCATTRHRMRRDPTWISLGTIAHKQGRVAGENALGGSRAFEGTVGTQR